MSIFAIGDIHGDISKLDMLLNKLHLTSEDELVFLGDYIDRGLNSYEVIECLIDLSVGYNKCTFLMGNHEMMFLDYLSGINRDLFTMNGGMKTISSYAEHGYDINTNTAYNKIKMDDEHVDFLTKLKLYYETEDYIFAHAGINPSKPLANNNSNDLLWDRNFHDFFMRHYKGPKTVVFGHTPEDKPKVAKHAICIDTGACFGGNLTCVKLPEMIFYTGGLWELN